MARIFISYKRVDKDKVFKIKEKIEFETGIKCWIDLDGIESDAQFKNVIIRAINECEVVLFMYSKAHASISDFEKDWTIRELNFAASKNKRIVFINLDKTPLTDEFSFDFGTKQQVDGESREAISRLISDIKKWLLSTNESAGIRIPTRNTNNSLTGQNEDINYSKGQETLTGRKGEKDRKKSFYISIFGKQKGCVVAISILASICILIIPIYREFYRLNSPSPSLTSPIDSSVQLHTQEQLIAVDLGLPSGTLWANMNVGAKTESKYGDLFAWGESKTKWRYTEYDYVKETKGETLHGHHDAAYAIMGPDGARHHLKISRSS